MAVYDISGNSLLSEQLTKNTFWNNYNNQFYWILHLDSDRKYFSVQNIKAIIDACAIARINQLELSLSAESLRLELDDMSIKANGIIYDLKSCLGGAENPNKWYTQSEMDEIISYANKLGIDIVPTLDMPGHMDRILSVFTQFRYENYNNFLNIKDEMAVNFALAIIDKYCEYFSGRGCKRYNVSYDEIMGWATGFPYFYNRNEFQYITDFANKCAKVIKKHSMVPRVFNEVVNYNNDYKCFIDRDYEVYYWDGSIPNELLSTPDELIENGYTVINSNEKLYWVNNSQRQVTAETLRTTNLLKEFDVGEITGTASGAMFCIWCDGAASSPNAGDNGDAVVSEVMPLIAAYGEGIVHTLSLQ